MYQYLHDLPPYVYDVRFHAPIQVCDLPLKTSTSLLHLKLEHNATIRSTNSTLFWRASQTTNVTVSDWGCLLVWTVNISRFILLIVEIIAIFLRSSISIVTWHCYCAAACCAGVGVHFIVNNYWDGNSLAAHSYVQIRKLCHRVLYY